MRDLLLFLLHSCRLIGHKQGQSVIPSVTLILSNAAIIGTTNEMYLLRSQNVEIHFTCTAKIKKLQLSNYIVYFNNLFYTAGVNFGPWARCPLQTTEGSNNRIISHNALGTTQLHLLSPMLIITPFYHPFYMYSYYHPFL